MHEVFIYIRDTSDALALAYNLDLRVFFGIYLASIPPFYLGYFLMLYGTTRSLSWRDVIKFNFKGELKWSTHAKIGLLVHIVGRLMPYIYIVIWGRNIPYWIYAAVFIFMIVTAYGLYWHLHSFRKKNKLSANIVRKDEITDESQIAELWRIYDITFQPINRISPCKQSFDQIHFVEAMHDKTVRKYILLSPEGKSIGIALVTDKFVNTPWISEEYFKTNYPTEYTAGLIFYFMGLAVDPAFRGNRYSISLIEYVIDDIPDNAIMGFDHSRNVNPMLHHFTRIVKQARLIERSHIDRQHYHVVQRKK